MKYSEAYRRNKIYKEIYQRPTGEGIETCKSRWVCTKRFDDFEKKVYFIVILNFKLSANFHLFTPLLPLI